MAEYLFDLRLSCYVSDLKFEPYYVGPLKLSKRSFPSSKICFFVCSKNSNDVNNNNSSSDKLSTSNHDCKQEPLQTLVAPSLTEKSYLLAIACGFINKFKTNNLQMNKYKQETFFFRSTTIRSIWFLVFFKQQKFCRICSRNPALIVG